MHKIDTETAGENNVFVNKDPTATPPIDGTDLNAEWFNSVQEELCNIILGFGGTLDNSEGFQDNSQILEVLKRIGVKCGVWATGENTSNDVDTSDFDGHYVIFHSAESFTIGALKNGSVVIVIPYWGGDSAPDSIDVDYKTSSNRYTINKGQLLVGVVGNGISSYYGAQLVARYMPVLFDSNGDMNVRDVNLRKVIASTSVAAPTISATLLQAVGGVIGSVQYGRRIDTGLVEFTADDTISWTLKSNWSLGQVKRVYCSDAEPYVSVPVYMKLDGSSRYVKFNSGEYREFVCIGFYTTSQTSTEYAVLLVNGSEAE